MKARLFTHIILFSFIGLLSGCATLGTRSHSRVIGSLSSGTANVTIKEKKTGQVIWRGETPTLVSIPKRAGNLRGSFYTVVISKKGHKDIELEIYPRAGGWFPGGGVVFGGLIGWLVVDPSNGTIWTLSPDSIGESTGLRHSGDGFNVVLLDQVPKTVRPNMVLLANQ
jgi:hypothetical protein